MLLWEDLDERFFLGVSRCRAGNYVALVAQSKLTSEVRLLSTSEKEAIPKAVLPREQGVEYSVAVGAEQIFVRSNKDAPNFQLLRLHGDELEVVVAHDPDVLLEGVDSFATTLVLWEWAMGCRGCRFDLATEALPPPTFRMQGS